MKENYQGVEDIINVEANLNRKIFNKDNSLFRFIV